MPDQSPAPWETLFPPLADASQGTTLNLWLVRKKGEPLLLLPQSPALAAIALSLYPAQTRKAKLARWLLKSGLKFAPGFCGARVSLPLSTETPFVRFLKDVAGTDSTPQLAMLFGNPRAPGRRFIISLFNPEGKPTVLIKAGVGDAASQLIEAEKAFLKSQPASLLRAATLRGEFREGSLAAFALDHVPGSAPSADASVGPLLTEWLRTQERVTFAELPAARRLEAAAASDPLWGECAAALRATSFHPAIHHGDFAPWNVRVDLAGQWHVFDWERGDAFGPPAWDWFHWVIQYEILVRRATTEQLVWRINELRRAPEFRAYVEQAGISTLHQPLLIAYLLYCCRVIRQVDGLGTIESLIAALSHPVTCQCHRHGSGT